MLKQDRITMFRTTVALLTLFFWVVDSFSLVQPLPSFPRQQRAVHQTDPHQSWNNKNKSVLSTWTNAYRLQQHQQLRHQAVLPSVLDQNGNIRIFRQPKRPANNDLTQSFYKDKSPISLSQEEVETFLKENTDSVLVREKDEYEYAADVRSHPETTNTYSARPKKNSAREDDASAVQRRRRATLILGDFLVFGCGLANVVTFKTFGFYASMMTGNVMRFCMSLMDLRLVDAAFFASTILSYTVGAAFYRVLTIHLENEDKRCHYPNRYQSSSVVSKYRQYFSNTSRQGGKYSRRKLFGLISATALFMFMFADLLGHILPVPQRWMSFFLGLGFGFVNAVSVEETSIITWAATGHINKIGMGFVERIFLPEDQKPKIGFDGNMRVVVIFMLTVGLSSAIWQLLSNTIPHTFFRCLPPVGTCIGLFYAILFGAYGLQLEGTPSRTTNQVAQQVSSNYDEFAENSKSHPVESFFWWSPFHPRTGEMFGRSELDNDANQSRNQSDVVLAP